MRERLLDFELLEVAFESGPDEGGLVQCRGHGSEEGWEIGATWCWGCHSGFKLGGLLCSDLVCVQSVSISESMETENLGSSVEV